MPSIKDLRKELRELRSHYPVSKMRKGEVIAELEKLRGPQAVEPQVTIPSRRAIPQDFDFGSDSEDDFAFVPQVKAAPVKPKAVPKAAPKAAVTAPAKAVVKPAASASAKPIKLVKGSVEAKAHMARLRELRKR